MRETTISSSEELLRDCYKALQGLPTSKEGLWLMGLHKGLLESLTAAVSYYTRTNNIEALRELVMALRRRVASVRCLSCTYWAASTALRCTVYPIGDAALCGEFSPRGTP